MKKIIAASAVILIAVFMLFYTVDNTETVIITRLGKPVRVVGEAGLHLMIPFVESKSAVTKRLMYYTSKPSQVITKDKKSILIDNYCVWRVKDPLKLRLAVVNERGATQRIDDVIYAGLRVELAKHDLIEIINESRRKIMDAVTVIAKEKAEEFGVEIVDIRIRKADLPKENEKNIFARMITERERIAKQYRSEGQEEAQKIHAKTDMDAAVIVAEAEKNAQIIKGEADAKAIQIYAAAFNADPAFYEYNTLINFYKDNKKPMKIVIGTDSRFFKLIKDSR
ncbi:MAG: protease modulator HflC [Deferribacteraceae bacterium]|jgi:membrane protease subunit HflC|nr:protease modulator HflC [Deferribacteraceae bacterium]